MATADIYAPMLEMIGGRYRRVETALRFVYLGRIGFNVRLGDNA